MTYSMTENRIDTGKFTSLYDAASKINKAQKTTKELDPRTEIYGKADKTLVAAGHTYARDKYPDIALPELDALTDTQKDFCRTNATGEFMRRESEAYQTVSSREGIEAHVRQTSSDKDKLKGIEKLVFDDDFAAGGGIAGDDWRKMYADYVATEQVAAVAREGPGKVNDEGKALFFGKAAELYAKGVVAGLKADKTYTGALIEFSREQARKAFLMGIVGGDVYKAAVDGVVRAKKIKLVGAKDDIKTAELENVFEEIRQNKLTELATNALDKYINSGDTDAMREGLGRLRKIL